MASLTRMPEQQYTAAKAAIEAAETTQAALSAYQTALESDSTPRIAMSLYGPPTLRQANWAKPPSLVLS